LIANLSAVAFSLASDSYTSARRRISSTRFGAPFGVDWRSESICCASWVRVSIGSPAFTRMRGARTKSKRAGADVASSQTGAALFEGAAATFDDGACTGVGGEDPPHAAVAMTKTSVVDRSARTL
jgi:hypothetical protein